MSMDNRYRQSIGSSEKTTKETAHLSPWARYWARQKRDPQDSHLVSFGQRITYTFLIGNDVASIHYDKDRDKIFYKGHNIGNAPLEPWMLELLKHFKQILSQSQYADEFLADYSMLLEKKILQQK